MHSFKGKWISNSELSRLLPRDVFHRQFDWRELDCTQHRNQHILFRKHLELGSAPNKAEIYVSADDYYKLYVNGSYVAQGPAPAYHFRYNYNVIDLTPYLKKGENVIAVHTLYQGLINRVWQSGDLRHGLICDVVADGVTVACSDESFLVASHSGYTEIGTCGYETQFLEHYDSRAKEVGFEREDFDDGYWQTASVCLYNDRSLVEQESYMLTYDEISPVAKEVREGRIFYDFGGCYVGYLSVVAEGKCGSTVTVRQAQELSEDGSLRYTLRAYCTYEETWTLADGESELMQYDYKSFRYAELELPEGTEIKSVRLLARHYPFELAVEPRRDFKTDGDIMRVWELCVRTQKYGVQEVIQDCMEREKGFYLGDGCYTALTNMVLTGDDTMVKKIIDDAFATTFITDTLMTCMNCSFMQEIAEYPLILVYLVLWHYRYTGEREYLSANYPKVTALLEAYRRDYEHDGLLSELDKWCVVEWPKNFRHGYDVDLTEGQVCNEAHVSINAYYIAAVQAANKMAEILGLDKYRDEKELTNAFYGAFYDGESGLYRDGVSTDHVSLVGNSFVYGLGLCRSEEEKKKILALYDSHGISSLSLFCTFPMLMGLARDGDLSRIKAALLCPGAWLRTLSEGGTTTFEGWGKDTKWNTSLFHLTMSYAALFIADIDLKCIFK